MKTPYPVTPVRVFPYKGRGVFERQRLNVLHLMRDYQASRTMLTDKKEMFAQHIFQGMRATPAYRLVYDTSKMKPATVNDTAHKLHRSPEVAQRIEELRRERTERVMKSAENYVRELAEMAFADPSELTRFRVAPCRHCYGIDSLYQWSNEIEFGLALSKAFEDMVEAKDVPRDDGGYGYDVEAEPNPACPVCLGDGVGSVQIADTSRLSPSARRLYGGVKQTKNGIEVLIRNQDAAFKLLGEHLGVFSKKIELTGANGGPLSIVNATELTDDQLAAIANAALDNPGTSGD